MNAIEEIKQKVKNFDPNAALSSTVATIGAMTTTGWINIGYFCIAMITSFYTLRHSNRRAKQDNAMREIELDMKREELRAAKLKNDRDENGE